MHRARLRLRRSRRCRRLGRSNDRRGRTRHRLGGDEPWRRLRFNGRRRLGARGRDGRLRRNGRRRRNCRARGRRRSRTRRRCRLCGTLCDRFQHIAGFRDVREIDLGLELVRRCGGATRAATRGGRLIGEIPFHTLRFVIFDGAGVRFLFGDPDLGQNVKHLFALDLEFPRQIINSNFVLLHYAPFPPLFVPPVTPS